MEKIDYIFLNGPINYIKLSNLETKQVVWLLMDYHNPIKFQRECEDYEAKNVDKYLHKIFTKSKETIDFLFEISPSNFEIVDGFYENKNYISKVSVMFKKFYKNRTKINKNIRLHFIDIRSHTFTYDLHDIMGYIFDDLNKYQLEGSKNIIKNLKKIISVLENVNKLIEQINKLKSEKKKIDINSLLVKILLKYENSIDKQNISNYFYSHYYEQSKKIINEIIKLCDFIELTDLMLDKLAKDEILNIVNYEFAGEKKQLINFGISSYDYAVKFSEIKQKIILLDAEMIKLGTVFMDCYFLRRITQKKDYIKKAIVYTGSYHSIVYIWFLIKFNDYKIVEYNYINTDNLDPSNPIDNLENIIKKSSDFTSLFEIFYPKKINQCVKIKNIK